MRSVLIAVAGAVLLSAQVDTAAISGVIRDRSGAVVPGAEVRVVQQETNIEIRLTTNDSGFYSAPALPPGSYQLFVSKTGFRPVQSQTVDLHVQDRVEMNFDLEVGVARSEVTISAAAPLLESATSSLGQIIGERTIKDLPLNGRSFIQLGDAHRGNGFSKRGLRNAKFISGDLLLGDSAGTG